MKYIVALSGENVSLAISELEALFSPNKLSVVKQTKAQIIINSEIKENELIKLANRSAMLKSVSTHIADMNNLFLNAFDKINWSWVKSPFCVRVQDLTKSKGPEIESHLASLIWQKLKNPSVNLEKPKTTVYFTIDEHKITLAKLLWKKQKARFKLRNPAKRPATHPTALKPKLARLLTNLSRANKGILLDPFCGTGAILTEASILGCKVIGTDIDSRMIDRAKINFNFYKQIYKYKSHRIFKLDVASLSKQFKSNSIDAIATDPPYGRSSYVGANNIKELYKTFLTQSHKVLKKGKCLAMLYPHYIPVKKILAKNKWKILCDNGIYVHGGLTRKVLVLKKI